MYATVQELVDALTLEEKAGQLFIVRPDALDLSLSQETINDAKADGVTTVTNDMRRALQQYPVGGICQFGKNIESPSQLARINKELQDASATPALSPVWRITKRLRCPATPAPQPLAQAATPRMPAPWGRPSVLI